MKVIIECTFSRSVYKFIINYFYSKHFDKTNDTDRLLFNITVKKIILHQEYYKTCIVGLKINFEIPENFSTKIVVFKIMLLINCVHYINIDYVIPSEITVKHRPF